MQPFGCLFKCDVEAPEIFPSTIDPMPSGIIPAIPAPIGSMPSGVIATAESNQSLSVGGLIHPAPTAPGSDR
jgi:hypothetical protein